MDDQNSELQILHELRRMNRINIAATVVILAVVLAFLGFMTLRVNCAVDSVKKPPETTWRDVKSATEQGRFDEALTKAKALIQKTPDDYYGHLVLGSVYLAKGEPLEAQKEYEQAYKLWPSEDNEKAVKAIRKRIQTDDLQKTRSRDKPGSTLLP